MTDTTDIVLRTPRDSDADDLVAAGNDPLVQRFVPTLPAPYTSADAHRWIREVVPAAIAEGSAHYVVADTETDRLLGAGGFYRGREATAEVGYWVAPWARRQGVATAAARALSMAAFSRGVERLYLRTEFENSASQRVAIAAGFTREGVERGGGANRGGGGRHDLIVWARLHGDPDGPTTRILPDLPGGELTDGVIALRPLGEQDIDDTYALRCLPDVIASSVPPRAPEREKIERVCARSQAGWLAGERADLTIRDAASGAYAGEIGLYYWEPPTQQAMIGYSMMPAWRGRGYAARAARLLVSWAFDQVGVIRVIAGTAPDNVGSQRVLERAGFTREGYLRSRLPGPGDTRIDDIQYVLIAGDDPDQASARAITP